MQPARRQASANPDQNAPAIERRQRKEIEPSKLSFLQISDSHVGFDKPANPNVIGTLEEAIGKIEVTARLAG